MGADPTEGSDASTYPELARANLLRMRGEYKLAEEQCLKILRKLPNNASANTLLGDVCAERGDLEQAVQWYELALELMPNDPANQQKLKSVTERIRDRDAAASIEQLGLKPFQFKLWPTAAAIAGFGLVIAIVVLVVKLNSSGKPGVLNSPINAPVKESKSADPPSDPSAGTANPVASHAAIDPDMQVLAGAKNSEAPRLLGAIGDPRTKSAVVTFSLQDGEAADAIAAKVGTAALSSVSSLESVTVRAVRAGNVVFVADILRSSYDEIRSQPWIDAHLDQPDAWIARVLSRPWNPETDSKATPPATDSSPANPPATSTSGGTSN